MGTDRSVRWRRGLRVCAGNVAAWDREVSPIFRDSRGLSFTAGKARLWIGRKMGRPLCPPAAGLRVCAGNVAPGTERSVPIFRDSRRPQLYRGEGEIVMAKMGVWRVGAGLVAPGQERSVPIFRDSPRPQRYCDEGEELDGERRGRPWRSGSGRR